MGLYQDPKARAQFLRVKNWPKILRSMSAIVGKLTLARAGRPYKGSAASAKISILVIEEVLALHLQFNSIPMLRPDGED